MSAFFGPGGNSEAFKAWGGKSTLDAPRFVKEIGLDAYEYEAGNGIASSPAMLLAIGEKAKEYGVKMSFLLFNSTLNLIVTSPLALLDCKFLRDFCFLCF